MVVSNLQCVNEAKKQLFLHVLKAGFPAVFFLMLFSAGCSMINTVTPDGHYESRTISEFEVYAEDVFRRQNQASSELIMLLIDSESDGGERYHILLDAEERILNACKSLNHIAAMTVANQPVDMNLKYQVMTSVSECDYTTRDVEEILQNYKM